MIEKLERSEEATKHIEQIREEAKTSPEKAQLGRMEILLDNAFVAEAIVNTLGKFPNTTKENLLMRARESGKIVHPEVAEAFVNGIYQRSSDIKKVCQKLGMDGIDQEEDSKKFYTSLLKPKNGGEQPDYQIHGKVEVDTNYPLAVIVKIHDERDRKRLRVSQGGFRNTAGIYIHGKLESALPVIMVDASLPDDVLLTTINHEKYHAAASYLVHALVSSPLEKWEEGAEDGDMPRYPVTKLGAVWGRIYDTFTAEKLAENLNKLEETGGSKDISEGTEYKRLLDYALTHAKEEILAQMTDREDPFNIYAILTLQRTGTHNWYDYLSDLGLNPNVYNKLWSDYQGKFLTQAQPALKLYKKYREDKIWNPRIDTFRWVLAQIPIGEWKEQLEKMPFEKEYDEYVLTSSMLGRVSDDLKAQPSHLSEEVKDVAIDFYRSIWENGMKQPAFDSINTANKRLTEIAKKADIQTG